MASSPKSTGPYDVFLSFRGMDVRNNFVGHLYRELVQNGIHTFRDSEELRKGENISMLMKAIKGSCIAVIVFSEDYASSWWCLEEVAMIMECKEQKDLIVLPVFYKVDPKEVRGGRTSYARGLAKHESKYGKNSKEMKRWKQALLDAGSLSGWTLNDGDDESKLIQDIMEDLLTRLSQTPLDVAEHPVGIESRVADLKSMLNLESKDDVLMVGLWGLGGIGKTTLGKAIKNYISGQFDGSSFLAHVRENSKDCKSLATLQGQLLNDILLPCKKIVVSDVDRGVTLIQDRLRNKRVLVILDNVDDEKQLYALAGKAEWFGNGSRILVTTRDSHFLTPRLGWDHVSVYEVKVLDDGEARELLRKHAFPTYQKLESRIDLVHGFLNHVEGLPLALVVLGSFLRGTTEDVWESILKKLSMTPNEKINNVLKVSYDGLEENEQEIFLHIACFFKGREREYTKKVLESCDLQTATGFDILIKRCLIRIEYGMLQMHDLIQLMGRNVVNHGYRDDPEKRTRLWLYDDVRNVLQHNKGDCNVKAIVLEPPEPIEIYIGLDAFTKMSKLRLLILSNVHNSFQDPVCFPSWLRWLEWRGYPHIPEFSSGSKEIVGLDMSKCSIAAVPEQFKSFQRLKYINFSHCKSLVRIPDVSCTPYLEELHLQDCKKLKEVHKSIADHDKLQVLDLSGCSELSVFPNVLKSINLRYLNLERCKKFKKFPDIPRRLEGLKKLHLQKTGINGLPASIENLVSLEIILMNNCKKLSSLPSNIYKLQRLGLLQLEGCTNLREFPNFEDSADPSTTNGLPNLHFLDLRGCNLSEVKFLENLSCLPLLERLQLSGNRITSLPPSISKRDRLSRLDIYDCHQLQKTPELPPSLKYLFADNYDYLQLQNSGYQIPPNFDIVLPWEEMPEWVHPVEKDSVSFMASKDLYDNFFGLALCFAPGDFYPKFEILPHVNGERRDGKRGESFWNMDLDDIWLRYFTPHDLWGEVDFGRVDGNYVQFSLTVVTNGVEKWGFRIIAKSQEDDLKFVVIDPPFLYEFDHPLDRSEAESSLTHEDTSSKADHELFSLEACEPRPRGLLIGLAKMSMAVFALAAIVFGFKKISAK